MGYSSLSDHKATVRYMEHIFCHTITQKSTKCAIYVVLMSATLCEHHSMPYLRAACCQPAIYGQSCVPTKPAFEAIAPAFPLRYCALAPCT